MLDAKFPYGAKLAWSRKYEPQDHWIEIAAWGIETFGLTGGRYIVDINVADTVWWFQDQQDQMMFILRNGSAQSVSLDKNK